MFKFLIMLSLVSLFLLILFFGHKFWTLRVLLFFVFTFDFNWHAPFYSLVAAHWDYCVLRHDSISTKRQPRMRPSFYTTCLGAHSALPRTAQSILKTDAAQTLARQAKNSAGQGAVATDAAKCPDFWLIVTYMNTETCLLVCVCVCVCVFVCLSS